MSYNPTTWNTGDIVTSEKLNKMEQGIANAGVLVCHMVEDNGTYRLDHTWQEIADAGFAVAVDDGSISTLNSCFQEEGEYGLVLLEFDDGAMSPRPFVCSSADDYPVLEISGGGGTSHVS